MNELDSANNEFRYLINALDGDLPNMTYVQAHKMLTTIFSKYIRMAEKNTVRAPQVSQLLENLLIDIYDLNMSCKSLDQDTALYLNQLCKGKVLTHTGK